MNYSVIPDLLAICVLIAVFRSVLERNPDMQPRYWLAGWTFVLLHLLAQMLDTGAGNLHTLAYGLSLIMMLAAGSAFIAASDSGKESKIDKLMGALMMNGAYAMFIVCFVSGVKSIPILLTISVVSLMLSLIRLWRLHKQSPLSPVVFSAVILLRVFQIVTVLKFTLGFAVCWILFDVYLEAVLKLINTYSRVGKEERNSMGMKVVIFSFFVWASVFIAAPLVAKNLPNLHIEGEVWNLPKFLVAVGMILTLLEKQLDQQEYLALHDELTGLPNRRLLADRLQQAINRSSRLGKHVALLSIDLNHFKYINDNYGHPVGDKFLQAVAERFQKVIRRADTIARTGGDEFSVVICDLPSRESAKQIIESLHKALQEPIVIGIIELPVSASIGMALHSEDGETQTALIERADTDMYRAKRLVGNEDRTRQPKPSDTIANVQMTST